MAQNESDYMEIWILNIQILGPNYRVEETNQSLYICLGDKAVEVGVVSVSYLFLSSRLTLFVTLPQSSPPMKMMMNMMATADKK